MSLRLIDAQVYRVRADDLDDLADAADEAADMLDRLDCLLQDMSTGPARRFQELVDAHAKDHDDDGPYLRIECGPRAMRLRECLRRVAEQAGFKVR